MSRIGMIAAGGESRRTGLSDYTSKAALPLHGKSLLANQIDFLRRSSCERAVVAVRLRDVRLLASVLSPEDRAFTSFVVVPDGPSNCGWADRVERALPHIENSAEVVLVSCDNDHSRVAAPSNFHNFFTYTHWDRTDRPPTDGSVLARESDGTWWERSSEKFIGDFFSGYAVVDAHALENTLRTRVMSVNGKKSFADLLAQLFNAKLISASRYSETATYEDVSDLRALALLNAGKSCWSDEPVSIGAGVLLHDASDRVLLAERQDGLGWTVPGGNIDPGERYIAAAIRELREEVGYIVQEHDLRLLGVYPCIHKNKPACSVIFHTGFFSSNTKDFDKNETKNVGWFFNENTKGRLIPFNLRDAVEDYFAGRELDVR